MKRIRLVYVFFLWLLGFFFIRLIDRCVGINGSRGCWEFFWVWDLVSVGFFMGVLLSFCGFGLFGFLEKV